jgi:sulfate transport system ATP-binding protein
VVAFARPHELTIADYSSRNDGVAARIDRILSFGINSRIELSALSGADNEGLPQHFEVELSKLEVISRNLREGLEVRIVPSQLKIFDNSK